MAMAAVRHGAALVSAVVDPLVEGDSALGVGASAGGKGGCFLQFRLVVDVCVHAFVTYTSANGVVVISCMYIRADKTIEKKI
jgi:hypothetical protein